MPRRAEFFTSLSQGHYDLHRQGSIDQERHFEKIRERIRENLPDIISQENIITSDGDRVVKVPIRGLQHPHFRFNPQEQDGSGQGNGDSQPGDVIAKGQPDGNGKGGRGAGDQPGEDYYEVGVTMDELMKMVFNDLQLPNLKPKEAEIETEEAIRFDDIRKKGPLPNLDWRRTIYQNIKRNAAKGDPHFGDLVDDDLRFRLWNPSVQKTSNAAILAMMDVSGSMGEFEKYIARSFYFWSVNFLRTRYNNVQIVFIAHHTEAKEVTEDEFFHRGESGGTKVSSAYQLSLDIIKDRFPPDRWNIYPYHFSDGENIPWDNETSIDLMKKLIDCSSAAGYGEINGHADSPQHGGLMKTFEDAIKDPRFSQAFISKREDVWPALKTFFHGEGVEGRVSRA